MSYNNTASSIWNNIAVRSGQGFMWGLEKYGQAIDWTNDQVNLANIVPDVIENPIRQNIPNAGKVMDFSYHDARSGAVKWISDKNQGVGIAANILLPDAVDFATGGLGYVDNLAKGARMLTKGGRKAIQKGDEVLTTAGRMLQGPQAQLATASGPALNRVADGLPNPARPLQMTGEEAVGSWSRATHPETAEWASKLTGAQREADKHLSKVVRYVKQGRWDELGPRIQNSVVATHIQASPIKYLTKYSGNRIMKAESHHILDLDFWGRALNIDNADMVTHGLYKGGIKTGNHSRNIVWAWSSKKVNSTDHSVLHKLYNKLESRREVEKWMATGRWQKMTPKMQARKLAEVAYEQHRVTNNFFSMKLQLLKDAYPAQFAGKNAKQIRKMFLEDLEKGGTAFAQFGLVGDPMNPEHISKLLESLKDIKYTGKNNDDLRHIFGLETPHAGNRSWHKSQAKTDFNNGLESRLNQAQRMRDGGERAKDLQLLNKSVRTSQHKDQALENVKKAIRSEHGKDAIVDTSKKLKINSKQLTRNKKIRNFTGGLKEIPRSGLHRQYGYY